MLCSLSDLYMKMRSYETCSEGLELAHGRIARQAYQEQGQWPKGVRRAPKSVHLCEVTGIKTFQMIRSSEKLNESAGVFIPSGFMSD